MTQLYMHPVAWPNSSTNKAQWAKESAAIMPWPCVQLTLIRFSQLTPPPTVLPRVQVAQGLETRLASVKVQV